EVTSASSTGRRNGSAPAAPEPPPPQGRKPRSPRSSVESAEALVPPQNLEAEESVLGAMLLSSAAIDAVRPELAAQEFYRESHSRIYLAALALRDGGGPVDAITLIDFLEERGELEDGGGRVRVHELAALVPATA